MARKGITGYATLVDPAFGMKERDTFTCAHCQNIRHTKPNSNSPYEGVGDLCWTCDLPICEQCVGKGCTPFEKRLKEMEARGRFE